MTNENTEDKETTSGTIKQTVDAVTALTQAVPIYQDAVQPLAKEMGKAGSTVGKAVNVALAPVALMIWGYDKISDFLENSVAAKLEKVPKERISTPPPNVAGPAIEALKFAGHDDTLRDLFANLIANSLDSKTVLEAHPAFVDIIKNISSDEGLILKLFASTEQFPIIDVILINKKRSVFNILHRNVSNIGSLANCKHQQITTNYLDNLCRLGLLNIPPGRSINPPTAYEKLTSDPQIEQLKKQFEKIDSLSIDFEKKIIEVTGMGRQFINACVIDKRERD